MAKSSKAGAASLHSRIGAFALLLSVLVGMFPPAQALLSGVAIVILFSRV